MSEKWCIVKSCCNSLHQSDKPPEANKMFSFPTDVRAKDLWLKILNVGQEVPYDAKSGGVGVCERHFKRHHIIESDSTIRLIKDAVPMYWLDQIQTVIQEIPNKVESIPKAADGQQCETASPFGGEFLRYLKKTANSSFARQYSNSYFKRLERNPISTVDPPNSLITEIDELEKIINTTPSSRPISPDVTLDLFSDIDPQEIEQYKTIFPNIKENANFKSHCTSCDYHIGTAPINETIIKMHPILRVTLCKNCFTFYNSGSFERDEDGTELYCRWCGQGGEVFCCSNCPYVFCRKCIVQNFSNITVKEIQNNENWKCFACVPQCMIELRANHWALINFIEKQKQQIISHSSDEKVIKKLMGIDIAKCCIVRKEDLALKRKLSNLAAIQPKPQKKKNIQPGLYKILQEPSMENPVDVKTLLMDGETHLLVKSTPDMSEKIGSATQTTHPKSYGQNKSICSNQKATLKPIIKSEQKNPIVQPPPLVKLSTSTTNVTTTPMPLYQTINSFCVDLNSAAQPKTFQLPPNLLQDNSTQSANPTSLIMGQSLIPVYFLSSSPNQTQLPTLRPAEASTQLPLPQFQGMQLQQRVQLQRGMQPQQGMQLQQGNQPQQGMQLQQNQIGKGLGDNVNAMPIQKDAINSPILQQQNTSNQTIYSHPPVVSKEHDNSPLGKLHSQFDKRIGNSVEVCQYIFGKINTLTNSTPYKTVGSVTDLKDLTLHLSYLLNYAIDRFKTVQENCIEDIKIMEFDSKITDANDDDLQIVEARTTTINLDSDEELEVPGVSNNNKGIINCTKEVISVSTNNTNCTNDVKQYRKQENAVCNNLAANDINVNSGDKKKHSQNTEKQMIVQIVNQLDQPSEKATTRAVIRSMEITENEAAESENTSADSFSRTRNKIVENETTTKLVKDNDEAIIDEATKNTIVSDKNVLSEPSRFGGT